MPLPKPKAGESEQEFMDRCMGDATMENEYPDNDQRLAVCASQWGKKSQAPAIEYRTYNMDQINVDARADGEKRRIVGHAAVFDTIDGNDWFRERIARGAFKDTIATDDIRALFNHDANYVLGRNKAGTLELREDEKGLMVEIDPPDTQAARDLMISISRGDITQMSFGFEILKESRQVGDGKEPDLYTLEEVRLWDVSPVTFPFYKETDVTVHSRQAWSEAQRASAERFAAKGWRVTSRRRRLKLTHKEVKGNER